MENKPTVVVEFKGRETADQVYRMYITNLIQAVNMASGDKALLREIEFELKSAVAHVENLQTTIWASENQQVI